MEKKQKLGNEDLTNYQKLLKKKKKIYQNPCPETTI